MNKPTADSADRRHSPRRIIVTLALALLAGAFTLASSANAQTVACVANDNANQINFAGPLIFGHVFTVSGTGIDVSQLGFYDHNNQPLTNSHAVTLFNNVNPIATVTVPAGSAANYNSGFAYVALPTPIHLPAGQYTVLAYGMCVDGIDLEGDDAANISFNNSANMTMGGGCYDFTSQGSPNYPGSPSDVSTGWNIGGWDYNSASASFIYTDSTGGAPATWTGGGGDGKWSTSGNWNVPLVSPTSLTFAGSTGLVNTNDLSGFAATNITFDAAAGAFVLGGNAIQLGGIGFNGNPATPITQTVNLNMALSAGITIDTPTNGNLNLAGNITSVADIFKTDAGTLTFGGTNTIQNLDVNGGTNIITGSTTLIGDNQHGYNRFYVGNGHVGDAGAVAHCNGTLIIQPEATFSVTGRFNDAAVIGRDGGSGTVIQNGGTFTFNPDNQTLFLIAATGDSATRAAYNMNGGLFDMSGKELTAGFGPTISTGLLNQAGGVITNVGNLHIPWQSGSAGYGAYTLSGGSIYIGSGGISSDGPSYAINLGGGTVAAQANWASSMNMTLTGSNGPVTFNPNGNTITLTGSLSGSGGLTVNGAGTLVLNGANSYTGIAHVTSGSTLEFDVTGTTFGSIRLDNGATLYLNNGGTRVVASCYTNGVALPVGTYPPGSLGSFTTGGGTLQVANGISSGIWDGGGVDNNWSTGGNWDQDSVPVFPIGLTFQGSTRLANNNDLSGITISDLIFDSAAGAFELSGNDITLSGMIGFNANPPAPITQTVNFNMTWGADKTINTPTNGNLTLNGNISASTNNFVKTGAGTLTFGGVDSFAGYSVNGGTNAITGSTTVNGTGSSRVYVGDGDAIAGCTGALSIEDGGTYNFTGSFGDYFVIGRDGGTGRIVQSGGNFSFAPSDSHTILLIAAGGGLHGYGEYDISGGVLDLNGNTLGAGWGDGGAVTGIVNQVGGAINNVFKLDLGAVKANGLGIYNLTGGSIAIDFGGITSESGSYQINLGGGTMGSVPDSFGWSSSLNMTLTGINGPVTFNPAGAIITLSGVLSGSGGMIVDGGGTLELSGANTYTGDTTVNTGSMLQLDSTGNNAGTFRVASGGLLNLNYSGTHRVPALYTNGVAVPFGTYNSGNLSGFITGSGDLLVSSGVSAGIWDGGGADSYWSTAGNWDNDIEPIFPIDLTFAGSTRLVNTNDLSGVTASSITFDAAAGAFVLNGNDITLNGNIGFNGSPTAPVTQTANFNIAWNANKTVSVPTNGTLLLGGNITTSANDLTKTGAGTLALGGVDSFAGYAINGGTNVITGNVTANGTGGSRFVLANANNAFNGTLVIQPGATFTVIGNWTDAGVIGRDGGQATVTQNGGTFNFNMGNQPWLFVGAAGSPGTVATYNMNGGLLDMNGKNLGLALAVNNITATGVVNQVGGVITNVSLLDIGVVSGQQGNGIYNLTGGSLYIGTNGITSDSGIYQMNLGGGTVGAITNWSSALNMTLTGINGPVTFDSETNTITLSGALVGSGGLTKVGTGTLDLSGTKSYTGDTTVNGGVLKLDATSNSSGTFRLVDGAMLNLNFGGTISVNSLYTNNVSLPVGTYNSGNLSAFITGGGSIQVTGSVPSTPTPIGYSISGGQITITWPPSYKGWILQVQTNSLSDGLKSNWVDVPGSSSITNATMTIDPSAPTVFYRLRYPTP